jgi:uncharacterized membrane protein YjfL (UPF0719 family)
MAAIFILAGGLFGFASAIASLVLLDASLLFALAIWSVSGLFVVILGLGMAFLARPTRTSDGEQIAPGARTV